MDALHTWLLTIDLCVCVSVWLVRFRAQFVVWNVGQKRCVRRMSWTYMIVFSPSFTLNEIVSRTTCMDVFWTNFLPLIFDDIDWSLLEKACIVQAERVVIWYWWHTILILRKKKKKKIERKLPLLLILEKSIFQSKIFIKIFINIKNFIMYWF